MKSLAVLTFVLLSLIQIIASASDNQVEGISSGIEQDLVSIISTALKYVSSDNHENICSNYVQPNNKLTEPSFKWDNSEPQYKGCFKDKSERIFQTLHILRNTCSVKSCTDLCRAEGFLYAGLQYSEECYCGNEFPSPSSHPKIDDVECQMECSGNEHYKNCGGRWALSLYETGNQIQVIDREGNKVDRDPLDSLEKYTKYTVTIYAEKAEVQQEIGEKVEEDRNDWPKPFYGYPFDKSEDSEPKNDENVAEADEDRRNRLRDIIIQELLEFQKQENEANSGEKVVGTKEADEEEDHTLRNFGNFYRSQGIDESDEIQPKTKLQEEEPNFDNIWNTFIAVVPINEDSMEPKDSDHESQETKQGDDDVDYFA